MKEFDPGEAPSIASIADKVRVLPVGMPVASIHFLGDTAVFVGAEENAVMVNEAGEASKVAVHGGAILCTASDGKRIVTSGDDGKVVALNAKGETSVLATDAKRRWIDNVALHPDGAIAWSAGKTAYVRGGKGDEKSFGLSRNGLSVSRPPGVLKSSETDLKRGRRGLQRPKLPTSTRTFWPLAHQVKPGAGWFS